MRTAVAVAINVYAGMMTSSPALTPAAFNATQRAEVPLWREMQYLAS